MAPGPLAPLDSKNQCWAAIKVRRQGEELGSLHDLRQRLNRFRVEMKGWAEVKRERAARGA